MSSSGAVPHVESEEHEQPSPQLEERSVSSSPPPADAGPQTLREERRSLREASFHWALVLATFSAALALVPLWAPLLLASWLAMIVRPLHVRLVRRMGGSGRAAAVITVLLVGVAFTPMIVLTLSLISAATALIERLRSSSGVRDALQTLLSSEVLPGDGQLDPSQVKVDAQQVLDFARTHGGGALNAASTLFGAATTAVVGLFVLVYGFYTFLVEGRRIAQWIVEHSPLERWQTTRLMSAFSETGRGLLIGVGLTALFQGGVATLGYVVIGVPQALVLGLLTTFAALIPSVGTGLVWAPLAVGLVLADRPGQAAAIVALGCVISVADNFVRPFLSRYARLDLPMFLLFVAMLGGIAMFGAWGLLLGPLFVRLAVEALRLGRDRRELGQASPILAADGSEMPYVRGN